MTKKVLIICAGGMSSSMIARQTMEKLQGEGEDVFVEACGTGEGGKRIDNCLYDLYLISPQTKMYFKNLEERAKKNNQAIAQIPPQAYIPVPIGIEKMAELVKKELK